MRLKVFSKSVITALFSAALLAAYPGCATTGKAPQTPQEERLKEARARQATTEERAAAYLQIAAEAAKHLDKGDKQAAAKERYNTACAELVVLLCNSEDGRLWNKPLSLTRDGVRYRLQYKQGNRSGLWSPSYFTSFRLAHGAPLHTIKRADITHGIGGALIGIRKKSPREPFAPRTGIAAAVTSTLNFKGGDVTLALHDTGKQPEARVEGSMRTLDANYSAPLGFYRRVNETWTGLMGAIDVNHYMRETGIYMLQPYDPDRIPVIFVHGLISTPQMWRNVINEVEMDPVLRKRYQFWVYSYPTGNPVVYSALQFRQSLAKAHQLFGLPHGVVLVAHSLGGLLAQMQTVTITKEDWDKTEGAPAQKLFADLSSTNTITQAITFNANPDVQRVLFICTPHRGANMANQTIGQIATRLITLPVSVSGLITKSMSNSVRVLSGGVRELNSISSLSPKNPTLKVMDQVKVQAPYHTIFGDRGKNDSPNSTDGIVPYWSSHMDGSLSAQVVPGPHSLCEFPQTIKEIKRVLHVHLDSHPK